VPTAPAPFATIAHSFTPASSASAQLYPVRQSPAALQSSRQLPRRVTSSMKPQCEPSAQSTFVRHSRVQ
jgi:hypothetical protein